MKSAEARWLAVVVLSGLLAAGCASTRTSSGPTATAIAPADLGPIPSPPREFRAAWIATVANIDWPSEPGLSTERQQSELRTLLDRAAELRLNAVILQVRPAADAFYPSELEPWSEYLTGEMGSPPEPFYDPLAFAVEEAHNRGLELHAWFNPYRAYHASAESAISPDHISKRMPDVVREYGDYLWLDPGEPEAHNHTLNVILDVVERYDIDGVHFDDYFYPYKAYAEPGETDFPDGASWARAQQSGNTLSRDDWRRQNVDRLIEELYREIKARKPHVKFGISPFGIWRPGYPEGTTGFDAYSELYADARKWLREGWVDYFTPQIYYRIAQHGQPYPLMLRWWIEQNVHGRHMWPGNYTGRARSAWPVEEIPGQIYVTRAQPGASGNVHFSMRVFMQNPDSLVETLLSTAYAQPALIPASPWLDDSPPAAPSASVQHRDNAAVLVITPADENDVWLWVVRMRHGSEWSTVIVPGVQREVRLNDDGELPSAIVLSAVDRLGNESPTIVADGPSSAMLQPPSLLQPPSPSQPPSLSQPPSPSQAPSLSQPASLSQAPIIPKPPIIPHEEWESQPPVGHRADGTRRNLAPGDSLVFRELVIRLDDMRADTAYFTFRQNAVEEERAISGGDAIAWNGYRVALLAANTGEGLGAGLAELEVATLESLPVELVHSPVAGGATQRLRIPHDIRQITLHHIGSPEPLMPDDDPAEKLQGLQSWGQAERNWWDVPYHFLIDLDGRIYEGRDYRYMGETNTSYDPRGHLLISVIGNYNRQEATPEQIDAITDLMAWATVEFGVSPDAISGHSDWAKTNCPGRHLQKYLDDGTFVDGVRQRLDEASGS